MFAMEASVGKSELGITVASELDDYVRQAVQQGVSFDDFERGLWSRVLTIGRQATQEFLAQQGSGDLGETVTLPEGRRLRRLPELHERSFTCVFGEFQIPRVVYGTREGQKLELVPLDTRLALPDGKFSYLLQDWSQSLGTEEPFGKVGSFLERLLQLRQHVDSLESGCRQMAQTVAAYRESLPCPAPESEGELLVRSADGKGVPMRRPARGARIDAHHGRRGPKPGSKQMAVVGAVYTVDRFRRTPEQVVEALFAEGPRRHDESPPRPAPVGKRVWACLDHVDECGDLHKATAEVFVWLGEQTLARDPAGVKETITIMDGQESLWNAVEDYRLDEAPALSQDVRILDLLHVTPRLWQAAHLFHPPGSPAAREFVRDRVLRVLRGEIGWVIGGLRQMATKRRLAAGKRVELTKILNYFEKNRDRMRYDQYLAAGYPIASGVIEGACRHLVKDRLERTGMRWTVPGAQAMLDLRSTALNGDWDDFIAFRARRENQRLHPYREPLVDSLTPLAA